MSRIEAIFFDCDGALVDSEATCSRVYVTALQEFGTMFGPEEIFKHFKSVKLHETIDTALLEHGVTSAKTEAEHVYRAEVARLSDPELENIEGAGAPLSTIIAPMCVISSGSSNKIQHPMGKLNMLHYLPDKLLGGYDIQHQKPDLVLIFHIAKAISANVESCILVDGPVAGAQPGIGMGMEMLYFCTDSHSKPIVHPKVTTSTHLSQLPKLWKMRDRNITAQSFTLPSLAPLKLALKGK